MTARKGARPYSRHGLNALKARIVVRGFGAIDRRSAAGRSLIAWRRALVADLGGDKAVTAQELALVDIAVRTRLLLDHLDCWLLEQRSLVNGRRRDVVPVLRERQSIAESLLRTLTALGLERRHAPAQTLAERLASRSASPAGELDAPSTTSHPSDAARVAPALNGTRDGGRP